MRLWLEQQSCLGTGADTASKPACARTAPEAQPTENCADQDDPFSPFCPFFGCSISLPQQKQPVKTSNGFKGLVGVPLGGGGFLRRRDHSKRPGTVLARLAALDRERRSQFRPNSSSDQFEPP